ncbi:MAG: hypothetical protein IBJ09_07360 [Bacteroidia bacterium]|nr:hypothetical protein [Bacteroidia bacterium]
MHTSAPKSKTGSPAAQEHKASPQQGITDNRPEGQWLAGLSGTAAGSAQVTQLQAFQQMADAYTQANTYVPGLKKKDAGEGVVQGVFIYSYAHQAIHAANKDAAYYEGLGFESHLSADGHEVWTDARNVPEVSVSTVDEDAWWRQFHIARNKLKAGIANAHEHEIRDENGGFTFRKGDDVCSEALIIQPKGLGKNGPLFAFGNIFCLTAATATMENPGIITEVSEEDANAYWEREVEKGKDAEPGQGSYKEYTKLPGSKPDDRFNCAAYAQGDDTVWIEPETMLEQLGNTDDYDKLESHADMVIDVNYIVAKANHFWRAKKTGADRYEISEKNGPSAIYKRTMNAEQWAGTMNEAVLGIYRKR